MHKYGDALGERPTISRNTNVIYINILRILIYLFFILEREDEEGSRQGKEEEGGGVQGVRSPNGHALSLADPTDMVKNGP